jgi:hypothetical protein
MLRLFPATVKLKSLTSNQQYCAALTAYWIWAIALRKMLWGEVLLETVSTDLTLTVPRLVDNNPKLSFSVTCSVSARRRFPLQKTTLAIKFADSVDIGDEVVAASNLPGEFDLQISLRLADPDPIVLAEPGQ